ncbi:MAG: hypothetical protein GF344_13365 [Chitinivibrionales bacterium]|nr:hypothetical protein [Chitinivibrionales bacterium]MBD3357719.1 hypothetical protein [Chitinivibrionales bacterium]
MFDVHNEMEPEIVATGEKIMDLALSQDVSDFKEALIMQREMSKEALLVQTQAMMNEMQYQMSKAPLEKTRF